MANIQRPRSDSSCDPYLGAEKETLFPLYNAYAMQSGWPEREGEFVIIISGMLQPAHGASIDAHEPG